MLIDLFFLVLTLLLGYLIYSRLGRRTGNERMPFSYAEKLAIRVRGAKNVDASVVETPFTKTVRHLQELDKTFSLDNFISFSRTAFEKIIHTYVSGTMENLKGMLSENMYDIFAREKSTQQDESLTGHLLFFRLISATVKNMKIENSLAEIQILFKSEQTQVLKDKEGNIVEGDENSIDHINELWTFQRTITRKNDPWVLGAVETYTESAN